MTEVGSGSRGTAAVGSTEVAALPAPGLIQHAEDVANSSSNTPLEFQAASQAQILRAHQRDTSQIHRLTELTSELIRSFAGTRWLATRQRTIDLIVRGIYLFMTLGRGQQTLGEEYTDILPFSRGSRFPKRTIRLFTIVFLLLPSLLTSTWASNSLTSTSEPTDSSSWRKLKVRLKGFIESPVGQALPELHMVAFLYGGRFLELGRRLTGLSYVSALPAGSAARHRSYEPLALLMLLPLLSRLLRARQAALMKDVSAMPKSTPDISSQKSVPSSALSSHESVLLHKDEDYDKPNTYLTADAQTIPERQCTLCLEPRGTGDGSGGTVAVTECGHIFCWGCLGGLERMECPLCRQTLRMERLVAAYNL